MAKRGKKLRRRLATRIKDWEDTMARAKVDQKAWKKPGALK